MEIQTHAPIWIKFCTHIPICPRRFWCRFDPLPFPPGPGGLETLKAEGHIFKRLSKLQINPGIAGYLG